MSLNASDIVQIIRGRASEATRHQFIVESQDGQSDVSGMLRDVAQWSHGRFSSARGRSPSSSIQIPHVIKVVRKAALWDQRPDQEIDVGLPNLVELIRGKASRETRQTLRAALADPESRLSVRLRTRRIKKD